MGREIGSRQLFSLEGHGRSFRRTVVFDDVSAAGKGGIALEPETISLNGHTYEVALRVLKYTPDDQLVTIRLEVKPPPNSEDKTDTRAQFDVGFFDFPLIDNTRLANGQRCAVTMTAWGKIAAELTTICFPGEYASIKDRPYYDEVVQQLRTADQSTSLFR